MSLPGDDLVRPFQIDASALRGRLARLGGTVDAILTRHAYPEPVAQMLGEAITLAVLLAGALKYEGLFTLQTKGNGPIRLMVADVTSSGAVRGYAQFDQEALDRLDGQPGPIGAVPRLLGAGYLAFTVDQGEHTERYQGIVDLDGASLADCVHHYFRQSEQIETGVVVAVQRRFRETGAGVWRAGGLMIQRLPPSSLDNDEDTAGRFGFGAELIREADEDGWRRALLLMSSCRPDELTDAALSADELLFRLFHEDGVRVFPAHAVAAQCRCSRERIERVLQSIPRTELADLTLEDGEVAVTCEFCGTRYGFDDAALDTLYRR
jgi:molecular chaperone Hsp33